MGTLNELQCAHGHLAPARLEGLARRCRVPLYRLKELIIDEGSEGRAEGDEVVVYRYDGAS